MPKKFTWSKIEQGECPEDYHYEAYYGKEYLGYIYLYLDWNKWVWEQERDIIMSLSCMKEVVKKLKELENNPNREQKVKGCGKTFYFDGDHQDYEMCGDNNYLCHKCKEREQNETDEQKIKKEIDKDYALDGLSEGEGQ